MPRRLRLASATAAAAALTAGPVIMAAPPAAAAAAKYADDFNGDGYRDYAYRWWGSTDGGAVKVVFGTATGPGTKTQIIGQGSKGVPGADEADDEFGEVRAAADFDRDGYGDLAVAAPGEDVDGKENQGAVTILWGSRTGLSGGTSVANKDRQSWSAFGRDLATGDFDGDGRPDLAAISGGNTYVYRGAVTRGGKTGAVTEHDIEGAGFTADTLTAGKVTKDSATDLVVTGATVTASGTATDAWFIRGGSTLQPGRTLRIDARHWASAPSGVIADFDKDGYGDIALGNPEESGYKGAVTVWRGGSTGPGTTSQRLTQATSGVAGTPEADDWFGDSLSAADVTGDGCADLAVGVRGEAIGTVGYAGGVHLFKGGKGGLTGTGSQWFDRGTSGVPGAVRMDDGFGADVRLRDTDRDGHADLFVSGTEGALRLPGTGSGLTTAGVTRPADNEIVDGFLQ
ncbi:FG-GAP-like repeat-containing protein [Streptomyces sclerotialus]|uniref:FG-GAP-like repeat-containing protein n=1 Tax=Streptomyces sclerotialus TaxID=1957 RepID=UPI0004C7148B